MYKQIGDNIFIVHTPELEALYAAIRVSMGDEMCEPLKKVCGKDFINSLFKKYRFIIDATAAVSPLHPENIFDYICDYNVEGFNLRDFRKYVLSFDRKDYFTHLFGTDLEAPATLVESLSDSDLFNEIYAKYENKCPDYLGFHAFFHQSRQCENELFNLAEDFLSNKKFTDFCESLTAKTDKYEKELIEELKEASPLDYSMKLLGKTFHNQGPYQKFIFFPSFFSPYKASRYFVFDEEISASRCAQQFLSVSLKRKEQPAKKDTEELMKVMKVFSDKTRYQILELLSEGNPVYGLDIVKEMGLVPSTISHHMDQLRQAGLVIEEPVKQSKYYTINRQYISSLLNQISTDLKLDKQ